MKNRATDLLAALAALGLLLIAATGAAGAGPAGADMRLWYAARASGITAFLLMALSAATGLVMSGPGRTADRSVSRLLARHELLWVLTTAFVAAHVVSLVADPYAGVGIGGALVPGLSSYRSAPVAVGALAMYALLITGATARWTRLLPPGAWRVIHRGSLAIFAASWVHGVLSGTDAAVMTPVYAATAVVVASAAAWRFWLLPRHEAPPRAAQSGVRA
jgi:sulfoxide reductase heme-binding subunit YedZ